MLKTKKSKIIIGAVAILAVLVASSIWVMANMKSNSVDDFGYRALAQLDVANATLTQLDHIIQDSIDPENGDASFYNVSIITPGAADMTTVEAFFTNNDSGFRKYVVNDNRTIDDEMNPDKVRVNVVSVGSLNAMSAEAIATTLGSSDLIYVYSGSEVAYTGGNAIGENLYAYLHNYAFGLNKPLIMNYGLPDSGSEDDAKQDDTVEGVDSRAYNLTNNDFKNSWKRTNTTKVADWTIDTEAGNVGTVLKDYVTSPRSIYVPYTLNNATRPGGYDAWADYWKRNGEDEPTLNVLYIHGDTTVADEVAASIQAEVDQWIKGGDHWDAVFNTAIEDNLPTKAVVTPVAAGDLSPEDFYGDDGVTKKYDYILIAPDTYKDTDLTEEAASELIKLSEDKTNRELTYILFGTLKGKTVIPGGGGSGSGGNTSLTIDTSTNFGKLIDLSITTNGYAKKSNILVVGFDYMNTMAAKPDKNPNKIAKIVTLINKSTYRTHAGSGSGGGSGSVSTTAYRILELQPCYPIDKELAASSNRTSDTSKYTNASYSGSDQIDGAKPLGNYYTIPANVLNTSEIDNFVDENGKMSQEYYQWDLSLAKVSYALNMRADQIELVQMSTDEYITAKADASDSYDLIYIGGNMSAFKNSKAYGLAPNYFGRPSWVVNEAFFSMYTHTGEYTKIVGNHLTTNNPYAYTRMNGNDITYDRLVQLKAYIDAGMPIVFSNEVWNAYENAKNEGYKNRYMDPDCNMFKLCKYAEEANKTSVLTNWENRTPYTGNSDIFYTDYYVANGEMSQENPSGFYGSAATVTVFNDYLSQQLYDCVYSENTSTRPKFTIDTTALTYVEGDSKTELTERTVEWTVKLLNPVEGHEYQAVLLEDVDDNAVFDMGSGSGLSVGERITTVPFAGDTAELSYKYPDDEFGAFSWKIVVQDVTNKASTGYSSITCFAKLEDQPKKQASILEIMPMKASDCSSENPSSPDGHTFYLDKNYQQSSGNPYLYSTYGTTAGDRYGYCPILHSPGNGSDEVSFNSNLIGRATANGNYQGLSDMNMGKYMTTLSVNRYDSAAGHEDRDYNYMDLVADEYDLSLDIMYMDDIEYYAKAARTSTEEQRAAYLEEAEAAKELYDAYLTEGTPEYTQLKEVEDALREALISIRDGAGYSATIPTKEWNGEVKDKLYNYPSSDYKTYGIDQMLQSRDYFRFFYLNTSVYHGDNYCQAAYLVYTAAYKPYIDEHDKMVDAYRRYRHYSMMAYGPEEYLRKNYDVIVVGFLDDYAGDFQDFSQDATDDLLAFTNYKYKNEAGQDVEDGGSLLMTHDNMTYSNKTSGHAVTLTNTMRSVMGMSPYGHFEEVAGTGTTGMPKYTSTDENRYFLTNLSADSNIDLRMNSTLSGSAWDSAASTWSSSANKGFSSSAKFHPMGYTDIFNVYETGNGMSLRYSYVEFQIEEAIKYNMQITGPLLVTGTAKATQVNRGVVTTYPFFIASDLRISNTHSQAFALDLEDEDVTVWYTLAADSTSGAGTSGGTNYQTMKENSSFYAATPRDGADNYYIYSVGNITYCGAGHALITGDQRDNNDERRLFLNVLINMAQKTGKRTVKETDLVLFDPDGTTRAPGVVVKRDADNGYYINATSSVSYPEFGFGIENPKSPVKTIEAFYDLDYKPGMENPEDYIDDDWHIRIPLGEDVITHLNAGDVYVLTKENHPALVTSQNYFKGKDDLYGGKYTYIVVRATLEDGTVLTKRIKIMLIRDLLDLT